MGSHSSKRAITSSFFYFDKTSRNSYYMNVGSYSCCCPNRSEFKRITSLSSLLKIVAERNRLKLLCILKNEEHCVCEIMEHLDLTQSLISHHLADLKTAGLVIDEKRGQRVYYQLTKLGSKIMALLNEI